MRYLLIGLFLGILISQEDAKGQEDQRSSWYPIISLKYGFNYGGTSGDFFKTYNGDNSFPRPFLISETSWQDYEAPDRHSMLAGETGVTIHNKSSLGISIQHYSFDESDEFVYTGIAEYSTGEIIKFPNTTEQHQFKSNITHVLAFFDYRIFGKSSLSPVMGLGIGFTFSSFEWNWNIDGRTLIDNNTILHLSDDQTFLNIDNQRNFAVQPRFRLDYSFPGSGFFNSVFLQTDYIFSKYEADYFETFRNLALEGRAFELLPQSLQTDAIKRLYDNYDVNTGGFELMLGLTLRFNIPAAGEKEKK